MVAVDNSSIDNYSITHYRKDDENPNSLSWRQTVYFAQFGLPNSSQLAGLCQQIIARHQTSSVLPQIHKPRFQATLDAHFLS